MFLLAAFCGAIRTLQEFLRGHVWDHRQMHGETMGYRMLTRTIEKPGSKIISQKPRKYLG